MWEVAGGILLVWLAFAVLPPLIAAIARGLPVLLAVGGFLAVGLSLLDGDSPLQRGVFATGLVALIIGCATFPRDKKQDTYKAQKGWDKWQAYHRRPLRPWEKKTTL